MRKVTILLAVLLAAAAYGQELLTNGDFELPLTSGWTVDSAAYGYKTAGRGTGYNPDPDYESIDSIYAGNGYLATRQAVDVPGVLCQLSFDAKFDIGGGSSSCWGVAWVGVSYYNSADQKLGETRIYYHNSYCNWVTSPTLSLIEVTNSNWNSYSLNVADEVSQHLPGVNPGDVARIAVALADTTTGG